MAADLDLPALLAQLDALARHEHDDLSIAADSVAALRALQAQRDQAIKERDEALAALKKWRPRGAVCHL